MTQDDAAFSHHAPPVQAEAAPSPHVAQDAAPAAFRGYPVLARRLSIAGREYRLCGPANYQELTDDERVARRFEIDEYMPYWADVWPGALMLAEEVASWPETAPGGAAMGDRTDTVGAGMAGGRSFAQGPIVPTRSSSAARAPLVLELGCGLGLVGLIAASRGYDVICGDYDDDALAFVALNARINSIAPPRTRHVDWRETYADIRADRIVAADVLYESRSLLPIADFIARHLSDAPDAVALLSDPNRSTADAFDGIARHSGLAVEILPRDLPGGGAGGRPITGRIFKLRRKPEH